MTHTQKLAFCNRLMRAGEAVEAIELFCALTRKRPIVNYEREDEWHETNTDHVMLVVVWKDKADD